MAAVTALSIAVSLSIIGSPSKCGLGFLSWSVDLEPVLTLKLAGGNRRLWPAPNLLLTVYRTQATGRPGVVKLLDAAQKRGYKVQYV